MKDSDSNIDDAELPENENTGKEADDFGFGLSAPKERLGKKAADNESKMAEVMPVPPPTDEATASRRTWKGFEEEEVYEPDVDFKATRDPSEDEMDMTPMVDVTFLLLIFFMVTASFVTQRSLQQPDSQEDMPSTNVQDFEDQSDYVEVIIDQNNLYRITSRNYEEIEAPSDPEMRGQLRDAKEALNARKLIITAHEEAWHEKVVKVWDFGTTLGFEEQEVKTTAQDF